VNVDTPSSPGTPVAPPAPGAGDVTAAFQHGEPAGPPPARQDPGEGRHEQQRDSGNQDEGRDEQTRFFQPGERPPN
jgi:hypothetical protein